MISLFVQTTQIANDIMPNRGSMKKGIIVLLITVLAAGMAFAGLTGSADVKANLDFNAIKAKESALALANGSEIKAEFGLLDEAIAPAALEEGAEAPAISVDFAATFTFKVKNDAALEAKAEITKAAIKGVDWSVSILGSSDASDYATMSGYDAKSNYAKNDGVTVSYKGFTLGVGYASKGTWNVALESAAYSPIEGLSIQGGVSYYAKAAGATKYGYSMNKAGKDGLKKDLVKNADGSYNISAESTTVAGVKIAEQALRDAKETLAAAQKAFAADPVAAKYDAVEAAKNVVEEKQAKLDEAVHTARGAYYDYITIEYVDENGFVKKEEVAVLKDAYKEYKSTPVAAEAELGLSAKVNYEGQVMNGDVKATVAADMIIDTLAKKDNVVFDVKGSASYIGAGLDVYYANVAVKKIDDNDVAFQKVLNAAVNFDLNKFVELPFTLSGKVGMDDILAKKAGYGRKLTASISAGYDAISATASFEYGLVDKKIDVSGEVGYTHEYATVKVGGSLKTIEFVAGKYEKSVKTTANKLGMYASVENTTLIPGATLGLSWNATDLKKVDATDTNKIGIVTASCGIAF